MDAQNALQASARQSLPLNSFSASSANPRSSPAWIHCTPRSFCSAASSASGPWPAPTNLPALRAMPMMRSRFAPTCVRGRRVELQEEEHEHEHEQEEKEEEEEEQQQQQHQHQQHQHQQHHQQHHQHQHNTSNTRAS